jgi:hypothetical protein
MNGLRSRKPQLIKSTGCVPPRKRHRGRGRGRLEEERIRRDRGRSSSLPDASVTSKSGFLHSRELGRYCSSISPSSSSNRPRPRTRPRPRSLTVASNDLRFAISKTPTDKNQPAAPPPRERHRGRVRGRGRERLQRSINPPSPLVSSPFSQSKARQKSVHPYRQKILGRILHQ